MTKSGLIQLLVQKSPGMSVREAEALVNSMFTAIGESLCRGERVEIRGFGTFSVRQRRPRTGINPKTGKPIVVGQKRVPFFTVGDAMRKRVNVIEPIIHVEPQAAAVEISTPVIAQQPERVRQAEQQ